MHADLSVDLDGLRKVIEFLAEGGVDAFTPCAMTGEAETLSLDEHRNVLRTTVEANAGRALVYAGVGRPSIVETRELIDYAQEIGSDGLFVITPFCNSYTKDEALRYYEDVAARTDLPMMIYNCPGYSGIDLSPDDHRRLSSTANIVATKEGNQDQLQATVKATDGQMAVFTARDSYLLPSLDAGAVGVVSFAANIAPKLLVDIYAAAQSGDTLRAQELNEILVPLVMALVSRSYPLMIKTAMGLQGLPAGPARRIEGGANPEEVEALRRVIPTKLEA